MWRASLFAVFLGAVLAGCGDGPDPPPTATPTEAAPAGPVEGLPVVGLEIQDLSFEGTVQGLMGEASVSCAWIRGSTPENGRLQLSFSGVVGDDRQALIVVVNGYQGPGSYQWDGKPGSGPEVTAELNREQRGHVAINVYEPGDMGDIEVTLTNPFQGRIYGLWTCPGVPR